MPMEATVLARNTSFFTLALITQKVISFLYFTFLARLLGPAAIGKYVLALSLTTIFSVLIDLGLASVLIREVARQPERAPNYFRLVIGFKTIASVVVLGIVIIVVNLIGYPALTRQLVYLAGAVMVLDSFTLTAYSTIRGFHNLRFEGIGTILMQVVVAGIGLLLWRFTDDLRFFMGALIVAAAVNTFYSFYCLRSNFKLSLRPIFNWPGWTALARLAWPFALAAILTRIYGYIDSVLLSILSNDHAVGIYSVAYKVTFAWQFIPTAFAASLFPGFSYYYRAAPEKLVDTFCRGIIYLVAVALPISIGIIMLAGPVVRTIYPAYSESIVPLQILISSLTFLFMTFPVGSLLPACNRQARHTFNIGLAALSNIILNLMLVPRFGPTGAALASLLSTIILLLLGWSVVIKLIQLRGRGLMGRLLRVVAAGAVLGLTVWQLSYYVHFAVNVLLSGLIYIGVLLLLGGVTAGEIKLLGQIIFRRPQQGN